MFLQAVKKEEERLNLKIAVWQAVFPELNALLVVFLKKEKNFALKMSYSEEVFISYL